MWPDEGIKLKDHLSYKKYTSEQLERDLSKKKCEHLGGVRWKVSGLPKCSDFVLWNREYLHKMTIK